MTQRCEEMALAEIEQAYRRYFPIIREKCTRMLRDPIEAQDVAQETFTRLWAKRASLKDPQAIPGWIYRTSTRLTIDRYRSRSGATFVELHENMTTARHSESPEAQLQQRQVLSLLGSRIPRKELEIAVLSRIDEMTHDDIAAVMGASDRTIRRLLKRFDERIESLRKEDAA